MPELSGPNGPIPYTRDEWGYPTIQARDADEGLWARGWFAGHDRPLQVAFTVRAAQGRLMETLGDVPFARLVDRAVRSLGLAHGLDDQVSTLTDESRRWLSTYCDGFNAGVDAGGWPLVLKLIGVERLVYTPAKALLYYRIAAWFGLTSTNHTAALVCAQLLAEGADDKMLDMMVGPAAAARLDQGLRKVDWPWPNGVPGIALMQGSNAFAVSGKRSKSGAGLLMTEFHMEIGRLPPVCWAFSIQLPDGAEHTGICIPGLPFISAGRNADVAWGWTFGHADNLRVTAEDPSQHELVRRDEVVNIRSGASETWTFWDFDGGTIMGDPSKGGPLPAVRWRGLQDTGTDIELYRVSLNATSAEQCAEMHREVGMIGLAGTFADKDGHIAWMHSGRTSLDAADGPDLPQHKRPFVVDPDEGFIASANEACPGWTAFSEPRYRHERLRELLSNNKTFGTDDLKAISYDELDGCARRLLPIWGPHLPDDDDAKAMLTWSGGSTPQNAAGRTAMGLFHGLHRELLRALVVKQSTPEIAHALWDELDLLLAFQDRLDDVLALEVPEHLDGDQLGDMIRAAWPEAKRRATAGDVSGPVRAQFKNLVTQGWLRYLGFSTPKMDFPGGPCSLFQSRRTALLGETLYGGPCFHLVFDLSEPGMQYNMAGGASEKRFGPGYGAGIEEWRTGVFRPMPPV